MGAGRNSPHTPCSEGKTPLNKVASIPRYANRFWSGPEKPPCPWLAIAGRVEGDTYAADKASTKIIARAISSLLVSADGCQSPRTELRIHDVTDGAITRTTVEP